MDTLSKRERSKLMGKIRSQNNRTTEGRLLALLRTEKITGWRRHQSVFGKPDFVFLSLKLAIFVDGCFWHGCARHARTPAANRGYWKRKVEKNKARDRLVTRMLRRGGWRVLRIWEHELARKKGVRLLRRIRQALNR